MTIKEFAIRYRVRTLRDSCGEEIIPGRPRKAVRPEDRSHVYDSGNGTQFGLCVIFGTPRRWTSARLRLLGAGFTVLQNGETEGTLLFDPSNPVHAKVAIKEAGIRTRKVLSESVKTALAARLKRVRSAEERGLNAKITHTVPETALATKNVQSEDFPR